MTGLAREARSTAARCPSPGGTDGRGLKVTLVEFSPSGGLFQFALQMGEAIAAAGHEVELVTGAEPERTPRVPGMTLSAVLPTWHPGNRNVARSTFTRAVRKARRAGRGASYLHAWNRLAVHLHRHPPDVVQWANFRFALDGLLVALLARRPDAPVMVDLAHTPRPWAAEPSSRSLYKRGPVLDPALGAAYRSMDAVFVLGDRSRQEFLESWPGVRRVEAIPHGDEGIYADESQPAPDACPPRALFFGTWLPHKNLDLLFDAFAIVRRRMPKAELRVAGAVGKAVDYEHLLGRATGIGGIELRPGYVPPSEVPTLFGESRTVVAPYRAANQSGVVHLAHTLDRPVVATDVGDLRDVVRDGETGLLVPPGDPRALADAIERLLRRPAEAARMGRAGRTRLAAESSWARVAERVVPVYRELVDARARSTS